jgi:hypothetical protein
VHAIWLDIKDAQSSFGASARGSGFRERTTIARTSRVVVTTLKDGLRAVTAAAYASVEVFTHQLEFNPMRSGPGGPPTAAKQLRNNPITVA